MSQQGTGAMSAGEVKQGLKKDVDQLRDDLGRLGRDVSGTARDLAEAAKSGAREAGEYVRESADALRERGMEGVDHSREMIRRNPLASVAIAFGTGLLLGALTRRL